MKKGLLQLGNTLSVRVSDSLPLSRRRGWEQIGLVAPLAIGGEEGGPKGHRLEIGYSYCQRQETLELVRRLRENDKMWSRSRLRDPRWMPNPEEQSLK